MSIRNVLYRLPEIKKAALEFPVYAKHFSIRMAGWHMVDSIRPRTAGYMNAVYRFIGKNCCDGIVPPASQTERTEVKHVWTCWWQGMENAPHIVKRCINQMKQMLPYDAVLHVITLENYREYVDIPSCISEKFEKNLILPAHFSDFCDSLCYINTVDYGWIRRYSAQIPSLRVTLSQRFLRKRTAVIRDTKMKSAKASGVDSYLEDKQEIRCLHFCWNPFRNGGIPTI